MLPFAITRSKILWSFQEVLLDFQMLPNPQSLLPSDTKTSPSAFHEPSGSKARQVTPTKYSGFGHSGCSENTDAFFPPLLAFMGFSSFLK